MNINTSNISGTCSMREINGLGTYSVPSLKLMTKSSFKSNLKNMGSGTKSLIYNSTSRTVDKELIRLGFTNVFSYRGNAGNVKTFMIKVSDLK